MRAHFLMYATLCLMPAMTWAKVASFDKTPQENAMCQTQIYEGRDTSDRASWGHMHHYCDCIRFTNRAYSVLGNWSEMSYNLQIAIGGCDYVLVRVPADFSMRPEIHLQKGKALRLYRQEAKAILEFMNAIKGNPALAQAYIELADIQAKNKKPQEALKTVTEGLRYSPESKALKRRYTELGGKLPYPEPIQTAPVEAAQPAATTDVKVEASSASGKAENDTPASAPVMAPEETASQTKIGTPKNPYCRFCPD